MLLRSMDWERWGRSQCAQTINTLRESGAVESARLPGKSSEVAQFMRGFEFLELTHRTPKQASEKSGPCATR